jgi:hypothetical protein
MQQLKLYQEEIKTSRILSRLRQLLQEFSESKLQVSMDSL